MIGKLVAAIFNTKAYNLSRSAFEDPRMTNLFDKYFEDTKKFKKELKDIGYSSKEDLKKALAKDPRVKNYIEF